MTPKSKKKLAEVIDFQSRKAPVIYRADVIDDIVKRARMHVKYDAVLGDLFKKLDALK